MYNSTKIQDIDIQVILRGQKGPHLEWLAFNIK